MKRKTSSLETRVYSYVALPPTENAALVKELEVLT
jgi:hypothetical protein